METEYMNRPVFKFATDCCALCQLSANNTTTMAQLESALATLKQEVDGNYAGKGKEFGQRAAFMIVSPGEDILEQNLKALGFKYKFTFNRRKGYAEGRLKMYCINI